MTLSNRSRSLFLAAALTLAEMLAPAGQQAGTGTLIVTITGARSPAGTLGVVLFKEAQGFPEDVKQNMRRESIKVDERTMSAEVVFRDLPYGTYAVALRHDENDNGKLDKNFIGIPKEGYGASNNPKPAMRAPNFEEAKFALNSAQQRIEIKINYR